MRKRPVDDARTASALFPRLLACAVGLSLGGCVTVPPSQRGELAKPEMGPAAFGEEETFYSHVEAAREAGMGGHGAQGGGCGCG